MPGLDSTGPQGQGSRSGRGLGKCNPRGEQQDTQNTSEENVRGRGLGRGRGRGNGNGNGRGRGLGRGR